MNSTVHLECELANLLSMTVSHNNQSLNLRPMTLLDSDHITWAEISKIEQPLRWAGSKVSSNHKRLRNNLVKVLRNMSAVTYSRLLQQCFSINKSGQSSVHDSLYQWRPEKAWLNIDWHLDHRGRKDRVHDVNTVIKSLALLHQMTEHPGKPGCHWNRYKGGCWMLHNPCEKSLQC